MIDWTDLSYLRAGTPRQRSAYAALNQLGIFSHLQPFTPLLAGTIPLNIDLPSSDLDIICEARDLNVFQQTLTHYYAHQQNFALRRKAMDRIDSLVGNFSFGGFAVEIFGQPRPVFEQNAYRHMEVEARLLAFDPQARDTIRAFKAAGMKTEPAFARYFHLQSDPYQALLELYPLDDRELTRVLQHPQEQ